jgi:hypothetical protein
LNYARLRAGRFGAASLQSLQQANHIALTFLVNSQEKIKPLH